MSVEKKSEIKMVFNSIVEKASDPTLCEAIMTVHDFELSGNGQVITEEICLENMQTLVNKRVVCKYIPKEENNGLDALKGHEVNLVKDRDGNEAIITETMAIGFITEVYIDTYTDVIGNEKRALFAKATLWNDERYNDVISLLKEWINRSINISMSVEYLYFNYEVKEGVEYIQSPIVYTGHCLLNSETRNEIDKVDPAYDIAHILSVNDVNSWNKAINKLNSINEGGDKMSKPKEGTIEPTITEPIANPTKSVNELSQEDVRGELRKQITEHLNVDKYDIWVSSELVYDSFFVYEFWNSAESEYQYFKASFSRQGDVITVDTESIEKVERKTIWVTQDEVQLSLNEKEEVIKALNTEKESLQVKYNEVSENVLSLNSTVEGLQEKATKYDEYVFNSEVNKSKNFYEEKFIGLNAKAKFESNEIQELIVKSVNDAESKMQLNEILIGLVPKVKSTNEVTKSKVKSVNENSVKTENLLPTKAKSFEERYGL